MAQRKPDPDAPSSSRKLLEFLVCPLTHTALEFDARKNELVSRAAGLAFPIRDGIPVMLVSEARRIAQDGPRRR